MPAKIIIASYDENLKNTLRRNISGSNIDVTPSYNIVEAASHFAANVPNVLIYDTDNGIRPSNYISVLLKKYNLLIILTGSSPKRAYDFFAFGVKDYIIKPETFNSSDGKEFLVSIIERIKTFFRLNSSRVVRPQRSYNNLSYNNAQNSALQTKMGHKQDFVIAIAASTGGTEALDKIMRELPDNLPPILIVQHMPSTFTKQFAKRLDNYSKLSIKEAENLEPIYPGHVYIAPGDFHITLSRKYGQLIIECNTGKKINGVRPSADVLFNSVAEVMGGNSIGVILTGMGTDGAKGLAIMKNAGSINIGQDEESCVIYGMPKSAYILGALDEQLPLSKIPQKIVELSKNIQ